MTKEERLSILEKEVDLIQSCINRMSQNSFMVKGWMIGLVTLILTFRPKELDQIVICVINFALIICLWYLDAFFLKAETLYRWKYNWVIANRLETDKYIYDLDPHNSNTWLVSSNNKTHLSTLKEPAVIKIMITKSLVPIYGVLIISLLIILAVNIISLR